MNLKGIIYTPKASGDGWVAIDLNTMAVETMKELPFTIPPAPPPPAERPKRSRAISAEELMEEYRTIAGLKALKGKIPDTAYEAIWHNYNQLRESRSETGEDDER